MDISKREELISAYLDGELDVEQKKRVEQLLVDDQGAAQLLEEFRAVRSSLRSLPSFKLEPDFAGQVVQQAERAASAGEELRPAADFGGDDPYAKRDLRRTFLWSGMAIAVAILLLLYNSHDLGPLALRDADHEAPAAAESTQADNASARTANPQMSARDGAAAPAPPEFEAAGADKLADAPTASHAAEDDHPLQKELLRLKRQGSLNDVEAAKDAYSGHLQRGRAKGRLELQTTAPADHLKLAEESEEKKFAGRDPQGITVYTYAYVDASSDRDKLNRSLGKSRNSAGPEQPQVRESTAQPLSLEGAAQERLSSLVGAARLAQVRSSATGVDYIYELNGTQAEIDVCLARLSSDAVVRLVSVADRPGTTTKNGEAKQEGAGDDGRYELDDDLSYQRGAGQGLAGSRRAAAKNDESTDAKRKTDAEKAKAPSYEAAGKAEDGATARPASNAGDDERSNKGSGAGAKPGAADDSDDSSSIPSRDAAAPAKVEKPIQRVLLVFRFGSSLPAAAAAAARQQPADPAGRAADEVKGESK